MAAKRLRSDSISPPRLKRTRQGDGSSPVPHALTIYSWNINGVGPFLQPAISSFFPNPNDKQSPSGINANLRDVLRKYAWPTMLLLQEVKIHPQDMATQRAIEKAVMPRAKTLPDEPAYKVHFCLPRDKFNARGFGRKIYGVCTIIREDYYDECVERVRDCEWDGEGRVLICETRAVGKVPKLAIINLYAVNGTERPYRDSETGQIIGTRHDRKLQVHMLLQAECRELEADGFRVILAGDMNIARTPLDGYPSLREHPRQHCINRADFEARFFGTGRSAEDSSKSEVDHGLGMIDSFRHLYPRRTGYTHYPRISGKAFGSSCDRVDMILVSRQLKMYLTEAGMHETAADRSSSDHVPLFATLSFERDPNGAP
ncbi:uncharacterized protein RCC_09632 [Ramularia collo-cygni]|uniref:Endonuclease/exonuclease/phosphatase domain-containing protein n=1 Tax=Ramularia collo-cygni TaxID=112498 RepID=A0A2D3V0R5_9PEZI|nr:uncharacterized protein RCC_09632 [Ramularia collo-cygni]CZT23917.1 uncharacterized protein RCC_09632 [Ramularia collo-cygni]